MIYTEFDKLEEVIVGDCYDPGDLDNFLQDGSVAGFNQILEETKEDFEKLSDFLKQGGVKVHRPNVLKYKDNIEMSSFDVRIPMSPIVPRDTYIVRGKTVYQTYTSMTDRYFDSLAYYDIFNQLFDQGYNWISQPLPILQNLYETEKWYFDKTIYKKKLSDSMLWHTATMFQAGDAVIYNHNGPGTDSGIKWMQRNMPDTRFVKNNKTVFQGFGHIDHGFILIDDNTVIHAGMQWVPECLRDKKLIDISEYLPQINMRRFENDYYSAGGRYNVEWIDKYLDNWKGYSQEVCFDLNVLILDSHNIIWQRELPELFKMLDKMGISSYVSPTRHSLYWEGGVHCATLDIKRSGSSRTIVSSDT